MTQVQTFDLALKFTEKLTDTLKPKLETLAKEHGLKLYDLFIDFKEKGTLVEVNVEIEFDITGMVTEEPPCIYFDVLYERCAEALRLDEEFEELDEEQQEKFVEECVNESIKEYRSEYAIPPFEFTYRNKPIIEAHIESRAEEDAYRICARDLLVVRYNFNVMCGALSTILESQTALEDTCNEIENHAHAIIAAVKALAGL